MSEFYQSRRTSITDSAGFLGFVAGFIGAAPFAWSSLSSRWESGDLTAGLLRFLITILGAAAIVGVMGMGLGSAVGWLWERAHRSRRTVRPDEPDASVATAPRAPPASAPPPVPPAPAGSGSKTLIIIFGPPAVGKMTVGDAIAKRTGLRLFHNHHTIDLALRFFEFGTPPFHRLVSEFRTRIFEEVAASALPGLVFTYVWAFESESDARFVERVSAIFRSRGADVYLVELEATQDERLRRNATEFRLAEKPPKRDLEKSRAQLLELDAKHRLNSGEELAGRPDYMRIDNTALSADEVAERVIQRFGIPVSAAMETV